MTRPVALHGHRGARGLFPENTIEGFTGPLP
jgi:glycerophosphoryl diester phosphodiesterase